MAILLMYCQGLAAQSSNKYIKQMQQDSFMLYFALPVELKAEKARMVFEPDFTYHAYEDMPARDQVTMNFSLFTKNNPVKEVDRIEMSTGGEVFKTSDVEFLYLEREGRKWHSRFTSSVPVEAYRSLLEQAESAAFHLFSKQRELVFPNNRKWRKSAEVVTEFLSNQ